MRFGEFHKDGPELAHSSRTRGVDRPVCRNSLEEGYSRLAGESGECELKYSSCKGEACIPVTKKPAEGQ
jgi:hypothetical protein